LTVIACALVYLCLVKSSEPVHAQGNAIPVDIVHVSVANGALPVGITGTAWVPSASAQGSSQTGGWEYRPLPVNVVSSDKAKGNATGANK
jgi:hypothetical protein